MSKKDNRTVRLIHDRENEGHVITREAADVISLNLRLIDSISDVLQTADVNELHSDTVANLMYFQRERLDKIRSILNAGKVEP